MRRANSPGLGRGSCHTHKNYLGSKTFALEISSPQLFPQRLCAFSQPSPSFSKNGGSWKSGIQGPGKACALVLEPYLGESFLSPYTPPVRGGFWGHVTRDLVTRPRFSRGHVTRDLVARPCFRGGSGVTRNLVARYGFRGGSLGHLARGLVARPGFRWGSWGD